MYNNYDANNLDYQEAYKQAERRVRAKMGFYSHLTSYVIINGFLIVIYLLTTPGGYPWFIWPMLGWGIGIAFHFAGVFAFSSTNSTAMRHRLIEEEMRRMGVRPGTNYATGSTQTNSQTSSETRTSGFPSDSPSDRY